MALHSRIFAIIIGILGTSLTFYLKDTHYWIIGPLVALFTLIFISYILLISNRIKKSELENIENKDKSEMKSLVHQDDELIYKMYAKLNFFKHHFDLITTKYKQISLFWIMICYSIIVFLLSSNIAKSTPNQLISIIFPCMIGIIGLILIWQLDLNIYTKLWAVVSLEEARMGKKLNFLIPSKDIELFIVKDREGIFSQSLFYMIELSVLMLSLIISIFVLHLGFEKSYNHLVTLGFCFLLFTICACIYMYNITAKAQAAFSKALRKL